MDSPESRISKINFANNPSVQKTLRELLARVKETQEKIDKQPKAQVVG